MLSRQDKKKKKKEPLGPFGLRVMGLIVICFASFSFAILFLKFFLGKNIKKIIINVLIKKINLISHFQPNIMPFKISFNDGLSCVIT